LIAILSKYRAAVLRRPSILPLVALSGFLLLATCLSVPPPATAQEVPSKGSPDQPDSLATAYQRHLLTLTSPELEARKYRRRQLQQQGYAEVLQALLEGDGVSALMSWLRTTLQLEYSLPHRPLYVYVRPPETRRDTSLAGRMMSSSGGYIQIPLREDRSFPVDPWTAQGKGTRQ
jgi:hypothetical protein